MRSINRTVKITLRLISSLSDQIKPFIRTRKYLGYTLYYSKGTLLMEMFDQKTSIYEPETCLKLHELVKDKKSPVFIDIGSNIGLISLYMARFSPNSKIFAFEPGPHQAMLFKKTITCNNLNDRIQFHEIALSNKDGIRDFFIHESRYAPGDGFIDTGRFGNTKKISVTTSKLDTWWEEHNRPYIDLIKIDTEGAELLVLEGAENLIKELRPSIVLEINSVNLKNYPYSSLDVYNKLIEHNYSVFSESGILIDHNNFDYFQKTEVENYLCIANN